MNVLLMAEKRGRISAADSTDFLKSLMAFDIAHDFQASAELSEELLNLGRIHQLTSYDAAYLELAMRRQLPLATLDDQLRQAAISQGIALLRL